ncbi:hypothetical protein ACLB2K_075142 [Fragaria x ananassa]
MWCSCDGVHNRSRTADYRLEEKSTRSVHKLSSTNQGTHTQFEFPPGSYSLYFRLQLGKTCSGRFGRRVCSTDQVHGWDNKPVRFYLSTSDGQRGLSEYYLHERCSWVHYHVGDFVSHSPKPMKIKFSMIQIDCTHTKGGLCLDSVDMPNQVKGEE